MFIHLTCNKINITVNIDHISHIEARDLEDEEIKKALAIDCNFMDLEHRRPIIHLTNGRYFRPDQSYMDILEIISTQRLNLNNAFIIPRSKFYDDFEEHFGKKKIKLRVVPEDKKEPDET